MGSWKDVGWIDTRGLLSADYHYNGALLPEYGGYRLFYRFGRYPRYSADRIATVQLDASFNVLDHTNHVLDLFSDCRSHGMAVFKPNTHVEDPRVLDWGSDWLVSYTDGYKMAVARVRKADYASLWSHYLDTPDVLKAHRGPDKREKNWVPFFDGEEVCFLYSDCPRVIVRYGVSERGLVPKGVDEPIPSFRYEWGGLKGSCPPVSLPDGTYVWFFHTTYKGIYTLGAYRTRGLYTPIDFLEKPILLGRNEPYKPGAVPKVIFPCSAQLTPSGGYLLCMGVNDIAIGLLRLEELGPWTPVPVNGPSG